MVNLGIDNTKNSIQCAWNEITVKIQFDETYFEIKQNCKYAHVVMILQQDA